MGFKLEDRSAGPSGEGRVWVRPDERATIPIDYKCSRRRCSGTSCTSFVVPLGTSDPCCRYSPEPGLAVKQGVCGSSSSSRGESDERRYSRALG